MPNPPTHTARHYQLSGFYERRPSRNSEPGLMPDTNSRSRARVAATQSNFVCIGTRARKATRTNNAGRRSQLQLHGLYRACGRYLINQPLKLSINDA